MTTMHSHPRLFGLVLGAFAVALGLAGASVASSAGEVPVEIRGFAFRPQTITVPVHTAVRWTNSDAAAHDVTGDDHPFHTPTLFRYQSAAVQFSQPGSFRYHCSIHPTMRGTIVVEGPAPGTASPLPVLGAPADAATLPGFGAELRWVNPSGASQVHVQVTPFGNDGPGVDLVLGSPATALQVPPPPEWYGLLPGMTYTWRVRASASSAAAGPADPSWSPWAERRFRTPDATSTGISALLPADGVASSLTPTVQWSDTGQGIFYYEFQLSSDPGFSSAMVYSALLHGGVTDPANSYRVPPGFPLQPGTEYHWRVRPRVQGDGVPVPFSRLFKFSTRP